MNQNFIWILLGAFAGSMIFIVSATEYSLLPKLMLFTSSLIIGVVSTSFSATMIEHFIDRYFSINMAVPDAVGAVFSSTISVRLLVYICSRVGHSRRLYKNNHNEEEK